MEDFGKREWAIVLVVANVLAVLVEPGAICRVTIFDLALPLERIRPADATSPVAKVILGSMVDEYGDIGIQKTAQLPPIHGIIIG